MPGLNTLLTLGAKIGERVGPALSDLGSSIAKGIRAYHGSPHDFERFDLSKIGTGEGAQAYGHGLYFAENPAVARDYREALSGIRGGDPHDLMTTMLQAHKGDYQAAAAELRRRMEAAQQLPPQYRATNSNLPEAIRLLEAGAAPKGRMYEVNIHAQPEQFLNYDVPFSQQSPQVQQALRSMPFQPHRFEKGATGAEVLGSDFAPKGRLSLPRYVDEGIPGIKYLDQGSRAAGQGSSNYVLFRDDIIDILRKYGLAGAAVPAVAKSLASPQE